MARSISVQSMSPVYKYMLALPHLVVIQSACRKALSKILLPAYPLFSRAVTITISTVLCLLLLLLWCDPLQFFFFFLFFFFFFFFFFFLFFFYYYYYYCYYYYYYFVLCSLQVQPLIFTCLKGLCHKDIASCLGEFCAKVITQCLFPYTKCSCNRV